MIDDIEPTDDELYERLCVVRDSLPPAVGVPFGNVFHVVRMRDDEEVLDALHNHQAVVMSRKSFEWIVDYINRLRFNEYVHEQD